MLRRSVLDDPQIRAELALAWQDSTPGLTGGVENGGFVVQDAQGQLFVIRWPLGIQDDISVPPHPNCTVGGREIVATFHTHPNTGPDYRQDPSDFDIDYVRDDRNLKGANYEGEYVISAEAIYHISPHGNVSIVGETNVILQGGAP